MTRLHRAVVIGGGTGIYPVVNALRQLPTECVSIINASDSGGSTGRIRDEFGFPPVGDLRQSLAAMADPLSQHWIRRLLLYRFEKGSGLKGHNLGNLFLTALQDMTGSTTEALSIAAKVLRIHGRVIPVTEDNVQLEIEYADGTKLFGEHQLDEKARPSQKVTSLRLVPEAKANSSALDAIHAADSIIIGPGDYYASLQSVLVVPGIAQAIASSKAMLVYFVNLMTRNAQTQDMSAQEHVLGIERCIGRALDVIFFNNSPVPQAIRERYELEGEKPVVDDLAADPRVKRIALLSTTTAHQTDADSVERSLIRHDEGRVLGCLQNIITVARKKSN